MADGQKSKLLETEEEIPTYYSSDDEVMREQTEVDPFRHKIRMTKLEWARTYVLAVVLVPVRLVCILICVLLSWLTARITLMGLTDEEILNKPLSPRRRVGQRIGSLLGRLCFRCAGFLSVTVKGEQADPAEAPILVAGPHSTFFDGFVIFWTNLPYLVSREENRKLPFLGPCVDMSQSISVKREDPDSKRNTVREIIRRTHLNDDPDPEKRWPQLAIFPEGSCANRQALMSFKPGAFIPGKPVQPVLIRYPNKIDTVTWTWNQPHGSKSIMFTTLSQLFSRAELEFLPVYHPTEEEKADPKLFANNVRNVMAKALGVPTNDLTFEEVKARYAKFYKNKALHKKQA